MDAEIIQPVPLELLLAELTPEKKLRMTNKSNNEIYIFTYHDSPNLMREIGRLREITFRMICKALRLKFNFAMLFLADEMFKNRGKTFEVTIGKPIPWQTFDKSRKPKEWAQYVQDLVYKL